MQILYLTASLQLLTVPFHGKRDKGILWGPLYKDTNPICEVSAIMA